jgi:formamidase
VTGLDALLRSLLAVTGASRVTLRQGTPDAVFGVTHEALAAGAGSIRDESTVDLSGQPVVREVLAGRQVVQDDAAAAYDDPAFHAMLAAYGGLAAQIVTPVLVGGELRGILSLHQLGRPRRWTGDEVALCTRTAEQAGALLGAPTRVGAERNHNRWHPDLEPVVRVAPGEAVTLETIDGLDGELGPDSTHADVVRCDTGLGHPLTGPVYVEGAERGDLLEVELLGYETAPFGVTPTFPGFGLLADHFPEPYLVTWTIADGLARSDALPGIAVPGDPFAGVAGVAPSHELMAALRAREEEIRAAGGPVVDDEPARARPAAAAAGLRTIPPRETGGNLDVRQLVAGARLLLPVHVPGALFSIGDLHFAQGDGEVCGTGIEVAGAVTARFTVHREPHWRPRFPAYETPARPARRAFATTGIPVHEAMDVGVAAREAVLEMIGWLEAVHGLERRAAYALCSACVDLRLSEVVDVPYPLVSALCPLDVFERKAQT